MGTNFGHAHSAWTRNTIYGAIVIHPEEGASYPFPTHDGEEVLVLGMHEIFFFLSSFVNLPTLR